MNTEVIMAKGFWAGVLFTLAAGGAAAVAYKLYKDQDPSESSCSCGCACDCDSTEVSEDAVDEIDTSEVYISADLEPETEKTEVTVSETEIEEPFEETEAEQED